LNAPSEIQSTQECDATVEIIPGLVSVVVATYNRSNVLRLAIESVRWQTYPHWEMIVVGDCCTDDTAEAVASFKDPRVRFYNLPQNVGEQSGPNNFGCQQARGEFIAFLNHDDLYFPHHLKDAVRLLHDEQADLVFARRYSIDGPKQPISSKPPLGTLEYEPRFTVPASCWVFRRGLIGEVGPWRAAAALYNSPSQDWIFRVFKSGKKTRCTPDVSVVVISSLIVDDTYKDRRDLEQRAYYELLRREPDYSPPEEPRHPRVLRRGMELLLKQRTWRSLRQKTLFLARFGLVRCIVRALGRHPHPLGVHWFIFGRGRKGTFIQTLRRRRGLPYKQLTTEDSHD
jgi:glycosyltransferase involved in cell wall biosynthesis